VLCRDRGLERGLSVLGVEEEEHVALAQKDVGVPEFAVPVLEVLAEVPQMDASSCVFWYSPVSTLAKAA